MGSRKCCAQAKRALCTVIGPLNLHPFPDNRVVVGVMLVMRPAATAEQQTSTDRMNLKSVEELSSRFGEIAPERSEFVGILDRFRRNAPRKESFAEMTERKVRNGTAALFAYIKSYIEKTYPGTRAGAVAGMACDLMVGQPYDASAFEGRTPSEVSLARKLADEMPRQDEIIRDCAAFLSGTLAYLLQDLASNASSPVQAEQMLRDSIVAAAKPLEYNATDAHALALVAKSYSMLGDNDTALEYANRAVDASPSDMNAHFTRGLIAYEMNRYDIATPSLEEAIRLEPRLKGVREMLADMSAKGSISK
jgi:tetratricopeptide (TPR) repeat protein